MSFKILGGNGAVALTPEIERLVKNGCVLDSIHYGNITATSSLTSSKWWDEADKMFNSGAKVIAVLLSP